MAEFQERTEKATPRRRQKAREEGKVAKSRDLSSIASIAGVLLILYFGGSSFMASISSLTGRLLSLQYGTEPVTVIRQASLDAMLLISPFLGLSLALVLVANVAQGGFILKPMKLNTDMLNPLNGMKRIFSVRGLMEFFKSLAKFAVGGFLVYWVIKKDLPVLPRLMEMGFSSMAHLAASLLMKAVAYGFIWFFILAVLDYFIQRWQFERSIRMSKEEIKEEHKESEGNPLVKSRIKSIQREMARKRMMQEVPKATVVITNPTHLAVALKYEDGAMAAPKVVAKGANVLAQRIKEIAREHSVPIVEDKPLARLLFKLELESPIPQDLYKAVAKILAYIYRLRGVA